MSDIPTIAEELDRKVIDELARLEHLHMKKAINPDVYAASVISVWNCASGLVPSDTMEAMKLMPAETRPITVRREICLLHKEQPVMLSVRQAGELVRTEIALFKDRHWIVRHQPDDDFSESDDGHALAAEKFDAILKSAVSNGYHII